jgi:hypothetical protein
LQVEGTILTVNTSQLQANETYNFHIKAKYDVDGNFSSEAQFNIITVNNLPKILELQDKYIVSQKQGLNIKFHGSDQENDTIYFNLETISAQLKNEPNIKLTSRTFTVLWDTSNEMIANYIIRILIWDKFHLNIK